MRLTWIGMIIWLANNDLKFKFEQYAGKTKEKLLPLMRKYHEKFADKVLRYLPVTRIRVSKVLFLPPSLHYLHRSEIIDLVWVTLRLI